MNDILDIENKSIKKRREKEREEVPNEIPIVKSSRLPWAILVWLSWWYGFQAASSA